MFQAAIDANRPVQPVRVSYRHRDGTPSTVAAFFGDHSLWQSIVHIDVRPLELPIPNRSDFAARCQRSVFDCGVSAGHGVSPTLRAGEQLRYSSNVPG